MITNALIYKKLENRGAYVKSYFAGIYESRDGLWRKGGAASMY